MILSSERRGGRAPAFLDLVFAPFAVWICWVGVNDGYDVYFKALSLLALLIDYIQEDLLEFIWVTSHFSSSLESHTHTHTHSVLHCLAWNGLCVKLHCEWVCSSQLLSASLLLLSTLLIGSFGIICFGFGFGLKKYFFFSRLTAGWDLAFWNVPCLCTSNKDGLIEWMRVFFYRHVRQERLWKKVKLWV